MSQTQRDANQGDNGPSVVPDEGATPQQTRRRLLKAATMAPAIYTLPVGSATAARSVMCSDKDGNVVEGVDTIGDSGKVGKGGNGPQICELTGTQPEGITQDVNIEYCGTDSNDEAYVFDGQSTQKKLTTGSCWGSLNPMG